MMLSELKKLKVAQLRAELQARGLDSKGLKAELVTRLLSAIEERIEPIKRSQEIPLDEGNASEPQRRDNTTTNVIPSEFNCPVEGDYQAQLARESGLQASPTTHSHADKSTQTENDLIVHICCCSNKKDAETKPLESDGQNSNKNNASPGEPQSNVRVNAAVQEHPVKECSTLVSHPDSVVSCRVPVLSETEVRRPEECRTVTHPLGERGRCYYEFKEEVQYNRAKTPEPGPVSEDEMEVNGDVVSLDPYNSDLHFEVGADGSRGQPLLWEKFPQLRSGCRLTHGFTRGKVGFEVKFVERLAAAAVDVNSACEPCVLRVGWSVQDSSLQLGEEELSFGLDGTGVAVTGGRAETFGEPFSEGDVIGCYASVGEDGQAELSFQKNGRSLGVAFHLGPSSLAGRALYPHVLCKNCSVSVNLDLQGAVWYPGPPGYCPLPSLPPAVRTRGPLPPPHRTECEVLLIVGMPASGKSHWVRNHVAKNPEKHYSVLSTDSILNCMKLSNSEDKELVFQWASQCLSNLIQIAPNHRRNFILDQANIYPSARRHKMLRFHGYQRKAVVVIPSDEEWKKRLWQQQQHEGTVVPEMSLLKSKVSFMLPEQGDLLEEVLYVELCHEEAQKLLTSYKEEARHLLPPPLKRKKRRESRALLQTDALNTAYGRSQNVLNRPACAQQSQWGRRKRPGHHLHACAKSYGCSSDPQQYRGYYQPFSGQWNVNDQNQSYYGNHYFSNQGFW